jgi:hypothetical protein
MTLSFNPSPGPGEGAERAARDGEGHTANGLRAVLRRRLERRARDCARNVRPSRAANNDPHLDPLPERARDVEEQGEGSEIQR